MFFLKVVGYSILFNIKVVKSRNSRVLRINPMNGFLRWEVGIIIIFIFSNPGKMCFVK